ncbi:MAG: 5-bromo-4-chloroindolyl phosphate hydrolysis family protein [Atopobiaceae bacterium]|jgi:predicted transcriptional regulator
MGAQDINDVGRDVMGLVSDAIGKGDFSGLSKSVSTSLARVAKKVGLAASEPSPYIIQRPEDRRSGQLQFSAGMVVALIGASVDLIMLFLLAFGLSTLGTSVAALVFACVIAAGVGMAATGRRRSALARHLSTYAQLCGPRATVAISELAQGAGRTEADVRKDLAIAYKQGLLPHGRITDDGATLFLTEDAYAAAQTWQATGEDAPQEVQQILDAGNAAIRTIDSCKSSVGDAAMTQKLDRLETTVRRILEQVQKKPASAGDLRRFMNYYLPTTVKLVTAYSELDRKGLDVKNVAATKAEISDTMDTINGAFEQVLDSTFQDEAWDISSDIHVMKTMMEQEGLTKGTGTQDGKDQARNG